MADGTKLKIKRGQHLTSIRKIAQGIGWYERGLWKEPNPKTISQILEWMTSAGMIRVDNGNRKYTLITIVNWDLYQSNDNESNSKVTVSKQSLETNNNDKNDKNDINISSSRKKPRFYSEDDRYYKMAVYFHNKVKEVAAINNKEHLVRDANLQKWADEFRKIVELDKRDTKELKQIIDWATSDPFWQTNILSPSKLRKQYVNLAMQMSRPRQSGEKKSKVTDNLVFLRSQLEGGERDEQTGSRLAINQSISSLPPFRS